MYENIEGNQGQVRSSVFGIQVMLYLHFPEFVYLHFPEIVSRKGKKTFSLRLVISDQL